MAWQRELMLPVGAVSSRTWRGRDESGRVALLREVPEGQTPTVSTSVTPGIVALREVVALEGRRYGVWDFVDAESLQDAIERLADEGRTLPLPVLARVIVDAARHLVAVTPARPHGGLSDGSLLVRTDGAVLVMDFGAPRPGRFSPRGPPSFGNDVFALGAVLHAALTGFGGSYADAVEEGLALPTPSQLHDECTPAIDDVIGRAIARSAEDRQPDLELLADELEAVLGEALATPAQVAEALRGGARSAPPVPDDDPGPSLGAEDDAPTGRHELPGNRDTVQGLEPVSAIPTGTQPGSPPREAPGAASPPTPPGGAPASTRPSHPSREVPSAKPPAGIPLSTQPGSPPREVPGALPPTSTGSAKSLKPGTPPRDAPGPAAGPTPSGAVPVSTRPSQPSREVPSVAKEPPAKPPAGIPMSTQPGSPPRDAFAAVAEPVAGPPPGIPMSTQPGVPAPALGDAPPDATQPRAVIPRAMASRPSKPAAPAPIPVDTQPRLRVPVPDTSENEVPTGATPTPAPVPAGTGVSHAKLEWAATQTRVPTPPVGVPAVALGDDEPEATNVKARAPAPPPTSGTAPVLDSVPSLETAAPSAGELPKAPGSGARRALIAVLLVIVAGLFGAFAWKKQAGGEVEVEQVVIGDEDAGAPAQVGLPEDAGRSEVPDAGVEERDEGEADGGAEDAEDVDGGAEDLDEADAGPEGAASDDAGARDAGPSKAVKKKPAKKKRRR